MKMHMPEYVQEEVVGTRKLVVLGVVVLLVAIALGYWWWSVTETRNEMSTSESVDPAVEENKSGVESEKAIDTSNADAAPVFVSEARDLEGKVIAVGPDGSYIRLSVPNEAIYSLAITPDTQILQDGNPVTIASIEPFAQVSVDVHTLPDTDMYDMHADTVVLPEKALSIEQRVEKLKELNVVSE